jgi:hypothetical protein
MSINNVAVPAASWREDLKDTYAGLFGREAGRQAGAPELWTLPDGWHEIVERLCLRLALVMSAAGYGLLTIERIRNKDAVMEVRRTEEALDRRTASRVNLAVALAMARSACTCERCGQPALHYRSGTHFLTTCDQHRVRGAVEIQPPWNLYHILREDRPGCTALLSTRQYDRTFDCFVDVETFDFRPGRRSPSQFDAG